MEKLLEILKKQLSHRHMELEKEKLDVFQFPIFHDGEQIDFAMMESGTNHPPHIHQESSGRLYIIVGKGQMILGSQTIDYEQGQTFAVPKSTAHGFNVVEDTVVLSVQDKPILHGDKLDFKYDERLTP